MKMLSLLHKKGTRIRKYFLFITLRASFDLGEARIRAVASNSGPVILPRMVQGAIRTRGLLRMRLALPDFGLVNRYSLPSASANHTGVRTGTPDLRKLARERYFCPWNSAGTAMMHSIVPLTGDYQISL